MINEKEIGQAVIEILKIAGKIALDNQSLLKPEDITYKFPNKKGPVTKVDLQIDALIREFILKKFPTHSIISEENESVNNGYEVVWIIDPIDGTRNYINQKKEYVISIGVVINSEITIGGIFAPSLDELYYADSNTFTLNDVKVNRGEENNVCFLNNERLSNKEPKELFSNCLIADTNSAALNLAYCSVGRGVGCVMEGIMIWDVVAGVALIKKSGGKVLNFDYKPFKLTDHTIIASYK